MGVRTKIYLDPGSPTQSFDLDGPHVFSFASKDTTSMICGANDIGKALYEKLEHDERFLLEARAYVFEEKLQPYDPKVLKKAVMKFYELATEFILIENKAEELINPKMSSIPGFSSFKLFQQLKRDIAGAVFICDIAIEKNKMVYWALG